MTFTASFPRLSDARDQCWAQMSGRTILILRSSASDFHGYWMVETALEGATLMPPPFWALHAGRRPFLLGRMRIAAALRQFFAARDFVEVETATLVPSPGNETHLHAFATDLVAPTGTRARMYLRTSPEFACKKLLAAGERRIVEFARAFRNRECGALHHPEFTMLEWYRAEEPCETLMQDCAAVLALAAEAAETKQFCFRECAVDPFTEPERLTVVQAFARYAGIDL